MNGNAIPPELRARNQWVAWKYVPVPDKPKPTKVPYRPLDLYRNASSTDPETWATFDQAAAVLEHPDVDGIGYVLTQDDGFVGIDLDDFLHDGSLNGAELAGTGIGTWIAALNTYTEISPSGNGLRIIGRATFPEAGKGGRKKGPIEEYSFGRFLTITGDVFEGFTVLRDIPQDVLDAFHAAAFPPKPKPNVSNASERFSVGLDDQELLDKAKSASNGRDFSALYAGQWEGPHRSQSEADLALCGMLAFWAGGDPDRIDRLFRGSGLMRSKWDERRGDSTYGARTIERVLSEERGAFTGEAYEGARPQTATDGLLSSSSSFSYASTDWPEPLADDAYHGLAGEIVREIEPHTEADPVALLVQLLLAFGNVIDRGPHFSVEADRHAGNLSVTLVGETSRGRKGTSWGYIPRLFQFEPGFDERVVSGLSSGEGLIYRVRDSVTTTNEKGESVVLDAGIADKRLLVTESEFASVLKVLERQGNTLSPVLRNAWDGRTLSTLTRNSPLKATGAHVSIVGHITAAELRRLLTETESANGFGNRFLWVAVRRSKLLPEGGNLNPATLDRFAQRLKHAVGQTRRKDRVDRDPAARVLWGAVYGDLSSDAPGLLGALTARAEAQVTRLSLLYALLDEADAIGERHLRAALALWDYSRRSVAYVFGDATGNPDADVILRALRASPDGWTRTAISDLFQRNVSAARIGRALLLLHDAGLACVSKEPTAGRPAERWVAVTKETRETNKGRAYEGAS